MTSADIAALPVETIADILATQANISILTGTPTAKSGYDIRGIDDIRMRGGRNNEVALLIDGVKVSNPVFGGFATEINKNAIKQMTIVSGGFSAKYGNALSGVINLTTRNGWKRFTGSFAYNSSNPFGVDLLTIGNNLASGEDDVLLAIRTVEKMLDRGEESNFRRAMKKAWAEARSTCEVDRGVEF